MNLAKTAIERPIWVAVSVVLIFLLGLLSIRGLPVQLFPDIDRPHLNITYRHLLLTTISVRSISGA
jgi:multidrug efflux pump subunit AcrB